MRIRNIHNLDNFKGTIIIPILETTAKSVIPIEYNGVSVPSSVFYGKKDAVYLVDKNDCIHLFIGLGKTNGLV